MRNPQEEKENQKPDIHPKSYKLMWYITFSLTINKLCPSPHKK